MANFSKFWKLAKWGKTKVNIIPNFSLVSDLETQEGIAKAFEEKTKAFLEQFFPDALVPKSIPANFQPIFQLQISQEVTSEEVKHILNKKKLFIAGGKDKLLNGFLRVLELKLYQAIATLTTTCWKLGYFPDRFKSAKMVCSRKSS